MKKISRLIMVLLLMATTGSIITTAQAQTKQEKLVANSKEAKAAFIKSDKLMNSLFKDSYAYAIFPSIGKGGMGIGGATGNGVVYEKGQMVGTANMVQVSIGFQFGGQAYREVIFFESEESLDKFKNDKLKFAAQASAVAVTEGASANAKYQEGVMVFTQQKGGLMYEASIGGQKFTYKGLEEKEEEEDN
ncbi:YSC84-related protein [Ferruginibacter paludis]|uniref:lipid-binding SYLF domain-containing protein n=1 Tax=Ferruginibacter paludis TaxID=1310417 RepID=UPI0025B57193|nr:YSC84-related protein [Ferruginibacter paludis]MDN3655765.1 YSC84-related protein [Ferruginibacter paludis]